MAVDVEVVEVVVHADDVDRDVLAHPRRHRGRVAGRAAPVDRLEVALQAGHRRDQLVQEQHCSTSGHLAPFSRTIERPEQPAERVERVVGPVVVVRPDADGVRRALPRVRELLAGRDEAADARVLAEVGAVVVGRVLTPCGCIVTAWASLRSALRKCTTITSPTSARSVGPGIARRPGGRREAAAASAGRRTR